MLTAGSAGEVPPSKCQLSKHSNYKHAAAVAACYLLRYLYVYVCVGFFFLSVLVC